jgi:WhiB family transcriptional regulator, redox-sensing transcriptional regulator
LPAFVAARRGAGLAGRSRCPPGAIPPGTGGTPPLSLEVRLDAVAAVLLDGLSYRRAGRMVGISKTEVGDSLDLLLGPLGALGFCQPDGTFITTLDDLRGLLVEMAAAGEAVVVDGLATRVQRPRGWANQKVVYDAKRHAHTAQGLAVAALATGGGAGTSWSAADPPPAGASGTHDRDQLGDGHLGQLFGSLSLLVALPFASRSSSAESSPWTSITLRARSSCSRSRTLSRARRANSRSRGSTGGRPRRCCSAASAPLSRCLRHSLISEVYRPSRLSSAPLPALSSCSYSSKIRSLYAAGYVLGGRGRSATSGSGTCSIGPVCSRSWAAVIVVIGSGDPFSPYSSPVSTRKLPHQRLTGRAWQLRTGTGQPPLAERLAATHQQLASPPPPVERGGGERDWRLDAACADVDPELFFPEPGQVPQAAAAKQVCAGCAVRGPCLAAALHGPQARDDHSGIFAGTTARQRVALRGRPSYAEGTRFVQDRAAAEAALALANQKSIDRAARELGVSKQALRRAFDHHGLPQPEVFQGGPRRTRFYHDRGAAEQAWQRAAEVGINQTRKELGVSDRALRTAWQRHGLGLPPRPSSRPATRQLDPTFVALNRELLPARARTDQELAARVRRAEVVVEMGSETHGRRPAARVWAITRRADRAHRRQIDRQHRGDRRQADRASRTDRTSRARAQVGERKVTADAR